MQVKICGIASEADLRAASVAGAAYAGFLVGLDYEAADALPTEEAIRLASLLPPEMSAVLVTHRTTPEEVAALASACRFPVLQLHGEFPTERVPGLRPSIPSREVWRAIHVTGPSAVDRAREAARFVDRILLDTRTQTRLGGTGIPHDWQISAEIVRSCGKPVVLAGGLTPENVALAVRTVRPWGVDVNSGVEDGAGNKDPDRIRRLIAGVSGAP